MMGAPWPAQDCWLPTGRPEGFAGGCSQAATLKTARLRFGLLLAFVLACLWCLAREDAPQSPGLANSFDGQPTRSRPVHLKSKRLVGSSHVCALQASSGRSRRTLGPDVGAATVVGDRLQLAVSRPQDAGDAAAELHVLRFAVDQLLQQARFPTVNKPAEQP